MGSVEYFCLATKRQRPLITSYCLLGTAM